MMESREFARRRARRSAPRRGRPSLVAHADWGTSAGKRWLARAALGRDGRYVAQPPERVGEAATLLGRLLAATGGEGPVFAGFDFPIGLPAAYAERVALDDFLVALAGFGEGEWMDFYRVATSPQEIGPRRPFYPQRPGGTRRAHVITGLGLTGPGELLRACDRAHATRHAAAPIFWTLGAQQVGKAAIAGWRDVLAPALRAADLDVVIWPFSGRLRDLFRRGRVVVAETYPAECYGHLGVDLRRGASHGRSGKRWRRSRAANARALRAWARSADIVLAPALVAVIEDGFGASEQGEDQFDAVVGLLGMLNVLLGGRPPGDPADERVRRVEGWILGQAPPPAPRGVTEEPETTAGSHGVRDPRETTPAPAGASTAGSPGIISG
jgi:hypothetical protein